MSTVNELEFYCNEVNPIGAIMLTGEWGCGKTHLIEQELAGLLQDTHIIVRVSLFGVDSIDAFHNAVKTQWINNCKPLLGKLQKKKDKMVVGKNILSAFRLLLNSIKPFAGDFANAVVAVNPLDFVHVEPVVEDIAINGKRRVVLVFDDLERSRLDHIELLGAINEYCENQHFNSIIVANEDYLKKSALDDAIAYNFLKEKIVSRTILNRPDFPGIIHAVICERDWPAKDYADFLMDHETMILDLFQSDPPDLEKSLGKFHNIRSLIVGLQTFYRIYYHMTKAGMSSSDIERSLYSFIAYTLTIKSGILRDGVPCFNATDEEITHLYPLFSPDTLLESVRQWILLGDWDSDQFYQELSSISHT